MNNNIIFAETTDGFPKKFTANNSKTELIARGLLNAGDNVTIINKIQGSEFIHKDVEQDSINGLTYYSFKRYNTERFGYIKNLINQCKILKKLKQKNRNNILIMGQPYFLVFLIEVFIYKILGYKTGITKTEWPSQIKSIEGIKKIDYIISDFAFGYFIDFILPISSYIEEQCKKFHKRQLRIPILARFSQYSPINSTQSKPYFLLCSTTAYKENIHIFIESFSLFMNKYPNSEFGIKLVLSGKDEDIKLAQQYILHSPFKERIEIYRQIPYNILLSLYKNATGLFIPLQDTIQDKARFSQKIAEYVSTGRPIITNNIGDIEQYFIDDENAYIAKEYSAEAYYNIFSRIYLAPEEANKIGYNGYLTGLKYFDNVKVSQELSLFLSKLF